MRSFLVLLALAALALPAAAVPEAEAPQHPMVARAWHEPAAVVPGQQWHGYLQLRPGVEPARVGYQVCNAGDGYCFAPTHDAVDLGNGTYRFDTRDYRASDGRPVDWEAGWTVGVRWFLADEDGNGTWIPRAPPAPTEEVPIPDLYLTFDIPGGGTEDAPGLPLAALAAALAALAAAARRRA